MINAMKCELCGGSDIVKQDGLFVCQHCGTKYSVEDAKKLIGTVKIDKSDEIENLYTLARRAFDTVRQSGLPSLQSAQKYYEMILMQKPNDWEANCVVNDDSYKPDLAIAAISQITDEGEQYEAMQRLYKITMLYSSLYNFAWCDDYSSSIANKFPGSKYVREFAIPVWEECIRHCRNELDVIRFEEHSNDYKRDKADKEIARIVFMTSRIQACDKSYVPRPIPENPYKNSPQSSGCYIATCVYGSYDCPPVWTLRRFRDNSLAKTWYGRLFIRAYYKTSPTIVNWFGKEQWFKDYWTRHLNKFIKKLQSKGVNSTVYSDK